MREGVSVQLLKETFAETGEIGFACHTRVDVGITYPAAMAVVMVSVPNRNARWAQPKNAPG